MVLCNATYNISVI